jgi:hypothetical protein
MRRPPNHQRLMMLATMACAMLACALQTWARLLH